MRYDHFHMLPIRAFTRRCGRMTFEGGKNDSPDAPDYTQMAAASEKAAVLGKELGDAQLAESKRQYDENMAVSKPIVDAQTGLMKQSIAQGDDYYNYMKTNQRPVEEALNADAMASGTDQKQQEAAATAEADSLKGFTKSANIIARQGIRYGLSPTALKKSAGDMSATQASNIASASGLARTKEEATGYAKKMDVAGLYRNLTGASQGSYGLALNAGNSANANQQSAGTGLLNGMAQGANMQQTGMSQNLQGLSSIMGSQTSMAGIAQNANAASQQSTGTMVGIGASAAIAI